MNQNRRVFLLVFMLMVAASAAFAQPKKKAEPVKEYTIEQFMNTVRIGGSSFSSDEKSILFHNNKTGIFNVYSVPVTGGVANQLTNSAKESTFAVSYFPSDARFIYTYDRGGNENNHLYLRELAKIQHLTPELTAWREKLSAALDGYNALIDEIEAVRNGGNDIALTANIGQDLAARAERGVECAICEIPCQPVVCVIRGGVSG